LIEECIHGPLAGQAADELDTSRNSRSAFSQSSNIVALLATSIAVQLECAPGDVAFGHT
jgi:hypothetical protein